MEFDRYRINKNLYLLGMLGLLLGMTLSLFALVILPNLLWNLSYNVPPFIQEMVQYFEYEQRLSPTASAWTIFLLFFVPGLILIILSAMASNKIEDKVYHLKNIESRDVLVFEDNKKENYEGVSFSMKLFFIIIMVFVVATLFHWLISTPPTEIFRGQNV